MLFLSLGSAAVAVLFCYLDEIYVAQAGLKLCSGGGKTGELLMFLPHFLSSGIIGVCHHAQNM